MPLLQLSLNFPQDKIFSLNRREWWRRRILFYFSLRFLHRKVASMLTKMKNKPNLDLYPFNKKKVCLDLLFERTFSVRVSAQELKGESLNLSTWKETFLLPLQEFLEDMRLRMSLSWNKSFLRLTELRINASIEMKLIVEHLSPNRFHIR